MNYHTTWSCGQVEGYYPVIEITNPSFTGVSYVYVLDSGIYSGYCVNAVEPSISAATETATIVDDCNLCVLLSGNYEWNFGHTFLPSGSTAFSSTPSDVTLNLDSVTGATHVLIGRYDSGGQDNYNYLNNLTGTSTVEMTQLGGDASFTVSGTTYYTAGSINYFALDIASLDSYSPDDTPFSNDDTTIKITPNI
jgi:hypothetical protein